MDPLEGPITRLPNEILLLVLEKAGGFNLVKDVLTSCS